MAHWENKTLTCKCASCGKELNTYVDPDGRLRTTWPLVGDDNGAKHTFPACTECYNKGWRPPGYRD